MMRNHLLIFLIFACFSLAAQADFTIEDTTHVTALSGKWSFLPQQFVLPAQMSQLAPDAVASFTVPGQTPAKVGTAWTKIIINQTGGEQELGLRLRADSAYRIYFGKTGSEIRLVHSAGVPALTKEESQPLNADPLIRLPLDGPGEYLLMVQISGHWYHATHIWMSPTVVSFSMAEKSYLFKLTLTLISFGMALIMIVYYLLDFSSRKYDKCGLWVFCIGVLALFRMIGNSPIAAAMPLFEHSVLSYEIIRKMEYSSAHLAIQFLLLYVIDTFKFDGLRKFSLLSPIPVVAWSLVVLVTNASFYANYLSFASLYMVFISLTCLILALKAWAADLPGSRLLAFTIGTILICMCHDLLLAMGVITDSIFLGEYSYVLLLYTLGHIRAMAFARTYKENKQQKEELFIKNQEVENLNKNLENKVAERTEAIQTILNNVKFGFLMIHRGGIIHEGFTKSCCEILQKDFKAGDSLIDLLELSDRDREHFESAMDLIFDDLLPEQAALANLPSVFKLRGRILRMDGAVIRKKSPHESSAVVNGVLFTLSDTTDLFEAEKRMQATSAILSIIKYRDSWRIFMHDVRKDLKNLARLLQQEGTTTETRKILHTIKGNSASFGLSEVSRYIHQLEESEEIKAEQTNRIENMVREFSGQIKSVIGFDFDKAQNEVYEISLNDLAELEIRLDAVDNIHAARDYFKVWGQRVYSKPFRLLLGPIEQTVENLCHSQTKRARLTITGGELVVNPQLFGDVIKNLPHLIRNAIAHGIEPPYDRADKEEIGKIEVGLAIEEDRYVISVEDDGKGIDPQTILARALERNLITPEEIATLTETKFFELLFKANISSRTEADEVAGRGVGLAAVYEAVKSAGGEIAVKTRPSEGTLFEISIPKAA
jgi:signal transduction histidine kinase